MPNRDADPDSEPFSESDVYSVAHGTTDSQSCALCHEYATTTDENSRRNSSYVLFTDANGYTHTHDVRTLGAW
jgi:hypothetical protein